MLKKYDKFFSGFEMEAYKLFGAHIKDGGMEFTVWAPHAHKIEVMTSKDAYTIRTPMKKIDERGVWQAYIADMEPVYAYQYRIYKNEFTYHDKFDPYAYMFEKRNNSKSVMYNIDYYKFSDDKYTAKRTNDYSEPVNIYEAHLGGFKKYENEFETYRNLKKDLIPYLKDMGYTHLELMPMFEYPFDGSWGYQSLGFLAATSRYGTPYDLMDLINECHLNGIGVIFDVVFVHFATDAYGLANYDFGPCYEYREQHLAYSDWGTLCFDFTSGPVNSFLMSCADFLISKYHVDGLRFDAVSHLIYHKGNRDMGVNVAGQDFTKRINHHLKEKFPNCMLIAEDSTDYANVTKPVCYGGLGFDYKWDLGWMNDTLKYYAMDPIYRQYHHNMLTFSMAYFYSERFLLPFSHDEVVHSKATIVNKMWGLYDDKFRQCRNLYVYMYTHTGKKLNFMGNEIGSFREFDEQKQLDWFLTDEYDKHEQFQLLCKDLNKMYLENEAFYKYDYDTSRFRWIDADNYQLSLYSYYRFDDKNCFVTILNMTPNQYEDFQIGVPFAGTYYEVINSENEIYGGCNMRNVEPIRSHKQKANRLENSIKVRIAPFAGIVLRVKLSKDKLDAYFNPEAKKTAKKKETVKKEAAPKAKKTCKKEATK
ncbi:MAG: 1,4-alpha-glucan branching protein GlgB [Erysipelotrichaceae bacterium]|nr:1,4-alpha-glucan branching protein GlgB [Erysipelotrichaceae bacterium]